MKKLLLSFAMLLVAAAVRGQNPCGIVITGDFDSQCTFNIKEKNRGDRNFDTQSMSVPTVCRFPSTSLKPWGQHLSHGLFEG